MILDFPRFWAKSCWSRYSHPDLFQLPHQIQPRFNWATVSYEYWPHVVVVYISFWYLNLPTRLVFLFSCYISPGYVLQFLFWTLYSVRTLYSVKRKICFQSFSDFWGRVLPHKFFNALQKFPNCGWWWWWCWWWWCYCDGDWWWKWSWALGKALGKGRPNWDEGGGVAAIANHRNYFRCHGDDGDDDGNANIKKWETSWYRILK